MRSREFISKPVILAEAMMKYGEWRKEKYAIPFIESVVNNEDPIVNAVIDGEEIAVMIKSDHYNIKVATALVNILAAGGDAANLKNIQFSGTLLNDEGDLTNDVVAIPLQVIVKDDMITGNLRVNLGNIAELVLGCAVTARYENQNTQVTEDDVLSVAVRLAQGNGIVKSRAGKDNIVFQASVPVSDKKAFYAFVGKDPKGKTTKDYGIKPEVIKGIKQHISSAVKYVNESPRVLAAVDKAAADPGKNVVDVISDGGNSEQQKTTKVDLKIMIDGTRLNLLSIKAGKVGQFGQVSGYEFERLNDFFVESVGMPLSPAVQKKFATVDVSKGNLATQKTEVREKNYAIGFKLAYTEIHKKLNALAKSNQLDLIERVYEGLLHHATRNEEGVEMVILSPSAKKAFSELTFGPELREALNDYKFTVNQVSSETRHIIQIYGTPVSQDAKKAMGSKPEMLVQYRSYQQKQAVRNIIEMGNLLKELADWEKIESRKLAPAPQQPAPVEQPVAKKKTVAPQQPAAPQQPIAPQQPQPVELGPDDLA